MNRNNIPNPFMGTYNYPFQPNQYYQGPYQQVQNTYRSGNICPGIPFLPPQQSISSIPNKYHLKIQICLKSPLFFSKETREKVPIITAIPFLKSSRKGNHVAL